MVSPIILVDRKLVVQLLSPKHPNWRMACEKEGLVENRGDCVVGEVHALKQDTLGKVHEEGRSEDSLQMDSAKRKHAEGPSPT